MTESSLNAQLLIRTEQSEVYHRIQIWWHANIAWQKHNGTYETEIQDII